MAAGPHSTGSGSSARGPGGIASAYRLLEAGYDDFVVLEKASGVGGTWFHNRYPGLQCDIASHLYSFSFEPHWVWSRPYGNGPEIREYMEHVVDTHGLRPAHPLRHRGHRRRRGTTSARRVARHHRARARSGSSTS